MNNTTRCFRGRLVRSVLAMAFALAGSALTASQATAQTNIVQNGGFESPSIGFQWQVLSSSSSASDLSSFKWSINGAILLARSFWQPAAGSQSIDLNSGGPGSISQSLPTVPGNYYRLRFYYSGHPSLGSNPAKMTVRWGPSGSPSYSEQFTRTKSSSKSDMDWQLVERIVQATSTVTVLSFASDTAQNQNYGVALDEVSVTNMQQATLAVTGPVSLTYGTTGTATTSGGSGTGAVTFSAGSSTGCTVTGATVGVTNASGTCVLTATKAGDGTYSLATSAPFTVALLKANQATLAVTGPVSLTYGTPGTATTSGGNGTGAVTYSASGTCTVGAGTGIVSATIGTGTCTIIAAKAADGNYNATTSAPFPVTLNKATQDPVTVTGPLSVTYPATGTATASGGSGSGAYNFSAGASTGCSLSGTTVAVINVANSCVLTATRNGDDNYAPSATSVAFAVQLLAPPLATPLLIRAVATSSSSAYLIGRVDGAASLPLTLQAFVASACTNGSLAGGTAAGALAVTTDAFGYFRTQEIAVPFNNFVAVEVSSPVLTARSACLVSSFDNDTWPRALPLSDASLTARDFIDAPGRARWYQFSVLPGQRIQVSLSGLPADYDLVVFKDIGAQFREILGGTPTAQVTRLSAEYAPFAISPFAISPFAISPSALSPDAYSAIAFASDAFSADVYSPFAISPFAISPFAISPSALSPFAISPFAISPFALSPFAISPFAISPFAISGFDPTELAQAFASAQTRSIIGASMTPGSGDELVIVNSWNNTGNFYVRVAGRNGIYSTNAPFQVDVEKGPTGCPANLDTVISTRAANSSSNVQAVFLWDRSRFASRYPADVAALETKLRTFATSPGIGGVLVDVGSDASVVAKRNQADASKACAFAKNLLAMEIKGIVDSYRANSSGALRYVVIVGNDDVIPHFRYPDQSLLGQESGFVPPVASDSASEASLRSDYVLSQDAYGSGTLISMRDDHFPVPGLAVGRLVESPADISGVIDAYIATGGVVNPTSSLVTGYDFLADAAGAVAGEFGAGGIATVETLIAPNGVSPQDPSAWTAAQLGSKLFGRRHDLVFLAGHFSANGALAADFKTSLLTTDLAASTTDFANSIFFSAGCHAGYNIVDSDIFPNVTQPLDWAQAFAAKKATLIAGTGYQYGDTDFIEYSERLYLNFARQLRAGPAGTAVAVGEALVKAKLAYLTATPEIRGIHEKALLEATLYGLPMLGVNMPAGRGNVASAGGVITPLVASPASSAAFGLSTSELVLTSADLALTPGPAVALRKATPACIGQTNGAVSGDCLVQATYWAGPDGVVANPLEPVLPLVARNVTSTITAPGSPVPAPVLRGVGFRGGSFLESTVTALTSAATTDVRSVHVPFVSPVFMPMRMATVNYFGALAGNGLTSLLIMPVQHRADSIALGTSTQRKYESLDLRLYYSSNAGPLAKSDNASIVSVLALPNGAGVDFTAVVVGDPAVGIHEAWVTYVGDTTGGGTWAPIDLKQCVRPSAADSLPVECGTTEDSRVWKGLLNPLPAGVTVDNLRFGVQAANRNGGVTYDDNRGLYFRVGGLSQVTSSLTFVVPTPAIAKFGDNVDIKVALSPAVAGKSVIVAIGAAVRVGTTDALGQVALTVPAVTLPGNYKVVASFSGDDSYLSSAAFAPITITRTTSSLSALTFSGSGTTALTARLGANIQPLLQESVRFTIQGLAASKTVYVITDYLGRATLPPTGLPVGPYTLSAYFDGNPTFEAAPPVSQGLTISEQIVDFGSAGLPASIAYPGSTTFTVATNAGQPVTVGLTAGSSLFCMLTGPGPTYTLTALAPGTCTLFATANGTVTFADVTVTRNIDITKGVQAIGFAALPERTYGDAPFTVGATGGATNNPVTFSVPAGTTACSVSGSTVSILAAGTCTVVADQLGNGFYNDAPSVGQSFAVNLRQVTVTADAKTKVYGNADPALTYGITSGSLVGSDAFTGALTRVAGENVGNYAILRSTLALGPNYVLTFVGANLTITARAIAVTADAKTKVYGGADPALTYKTTTGSLVPGDAFSGTLTRVAGEDVGTYAIQQGTLAAGANYALTYVGANLTITKIGTTTTIISSNNPSSYSDPVTLTATVAATAVGAGTPPATVTLNDGATQLCTGSISCQASLSTLTPGTRALVATYSGNANFNGSSGTLNQVVNTKSTTTTLAASPTSAPYGATVTLTATVAPAAATGTVSFADGSTTLGLSALSSGTATFSTSTLAVGTHTLTAVYAGSTNYAQSPPSAPFTVTINAAFTATGPMAQSRSEHTATLLNDGRVLVAGGFNASGASTATSEVYCPKSMAAPTTALCPNGVGKFSNVGNLPSKSAGHTATLLPNGKVLATGGGNSSSELFNPTTNSWSSAGSLSSTRSYHTATLLGNGKVLFTGGAGNSANTLNTTALYTVATGTYAAGPNLTTARELHTATLLPNGKVLIAGGRKSGGSSDDDDDRNYSALNTAEIYDPATNTFTATPVMNAQHEDHAAVLLPNGKVLVTGGGNGTSAGAGAAAEVYDPATNTWALTGSMQTAREGHTLTLLAGGKVLAAGGRTAAGRLNSAELYDPALSTFQPAASAMTAYRAEHTATLLPDGSVLVVGGAGGASSAANASLSSAELYGGSPGP